MRSSIGSDSVVHSSRDFRPRECWLQRSHDAEQWDIAAHCREESILILDEGCLRVQERIRSVFRSALGLND